MKKIEAIIRNEKLESVRKALDEAKCPGMTVWEIVGHGKQKGIRGEFQGQEFKVDFMPKTKIEVVVPDSKAPSILEAILRTAATGEVGDGKIFISDIEEAVRIRTAEKGDTAVV